MDGRTSHPSSGKEPPWGRRQLHLPTCLVERRGQNGQRKRMEGRKVAVPPSPPVRMIPTERKEVRKEVLEAKVTPVRVKVKS